MPLRLFKLYQRKRVININVNVTIAGLLALVLAVYPVKLIGHVIPEEHRLLRVVLPYFIDMLLDGAVYFALHWLANHWKPGDPEPVDRARIKRFFSDALVVQAERIALVPIFALIAFGGMWIHEHHRVLDIAYHWAFVLTYLTAIGITRILHTIIGYQTGTFDDKLHAKKERIRKRRRARAERAADRDPPA